MDESLKLFYFVQSKIGINKINIHQLVNMPDNRMLKDYNKIKRSMNT